MIHMMEKNNLQEVREDENWMWCGVEYADRFNEVKHLCNTWHVTK